MWYSFKVILLKKWVYLRPLKRVPKRLGRLVSTTYCDGEPTGCENYFAVLLCLAELAQQIGTGAYYVHYEAGTLKIYAKD